MSCGLEIHNWDDDDDDDESTGKCSEWKETRKSRNVLVLSYADQLVPGVETTAPIEDVTLRRTLSHNDV